MGKDHGTKFYTKVSSSTNQKSNGAHHVLFTLPKLEVHTTLVNNQKLHSKLDFNKIIKRGEGFPQSEDQNLVTSRSTY